MVNSYFYELAPNCSNLPVWLPIGLVLARPDKIPKLV